MTYFPSVKGLIIVGVIFVICKIEKYQQNNTK